jgi:N-acetyl-alpha-D-muramate 1-phosphate uridylyltransferase
MKAMLLAAGRGQRMGHLTQNTPKPLLKVGNESLIIRHLHALSEIGVAEVVINVSYLHQQLQDTLGDGSDFDLQIYYSIEEEVLGTGGGIFNVLDRFDDQSFILLSADIWTDYPFFKLPTTIDGLAHLVLVDNPSFHPEGDFCLQQGYVHHGDSNRLNYAGIAVLSPQLFADCSKGYFSLSPLFDKAIIDRQVTGEYYHGHWFNVGTEEELANANKVANAMHSSDEDFTKSDPGKLKSVRTISLSAASSV